MTAPTRGALVRAGFLDADRSGRCLEDLADWASDEVVALLAASPDPDQAVLGLVRLSEAVDGEHREQLGALLTDRSQHGPGRRRLIQLLGSSSGLTDHLVRHPAHWREVADAQLRDAATVYEQVARDVGDATGTPAYDALRVAYRRQLVRIAAYDVTSDPIEALPIVGESLADLAGACLEAALGIARREVDGAERARLAVIGMGKCGGRELNYVSDVDVIFAAEPAEGDDDETGAREIAGKLAVATIQACSAHTAEGTLWEVDTALRPEGKQGPLVRTVAGHAAYYERWAKTWEFQALLKARHVAGDAEVGAAYLDAMLPMVWQASTRENFVQDVQAMRARVEQYVPASESERQLKLGPGGLRDVEFSVQLLQLVHGRSDEHLRNRATLVGIESLMRGGYVGRTDAHELDRCYRILRVLEHRIQLSRMRRTHLMPTDPEQLRPLGRALGITRDPAEGVVKLWRDTARDVRRLYERLFFRPLLSAVARLSDDDACLSLDSAQDRFAALGYADPKGAIGHIQALTGGVSRRAAIQRTLLPVMLHWFAQEADPDLGLLAFRRISDRLGGTHWYLKMLRDEGGAAQLMARVLASSRYAGQLIEGAPSSVAVFGSAGARIPLRRAQIVDALRAAIDRHDDPDDAVRAIRETRRTELIRVAVADIAGTLDLDTLEQALTDIAAATIQSALDVAIRQVERTTGGPLATRIAVIGMGRLGGRETGYSSDADVLFVHDPHEGAESGLAQTQATQVVNRLRDSLGASGPDPSLTVDADLRPEGKSGPIVRTLASYAAYYERWSAGWEAQALLRAAPIAGDVDLGERFVRLIDPLRYPEGGIDDAAVRQIRRLKARMEAERIPRGGDRRTHFKLGRGGMSDVEWTVQLAQLEHAHEIPALRHTGTYSLLAVMAQHDLLTEEEADTLGATWSLATRMRNAGVLWRGRAMESLPSSLADVRGIASLLGWPLTRSYGLQEDYLRQTRLARAIIEHRFYESDLTEGRDAFPTPR
ncbi:bifunctional [glutamine synthetase] adenylyltransferase/[glutamine synthetase]-adenylyl-L-tyrosine phosphorylase [Allobranchiibius sp. GilTou38]|uniref:bifunctional [glutamine synthetase] adenylyltransferase/[glutamine synthetase]-adenylyl-L-tyrosine phosphorylase n=1 Tax=Allobranchiibius sp. GilTou38 TaxID=2815210 RepID=UPI003261AB84